MINEYSNIKQAIRYKNLVICDAVLEIVFTVHSISKNSNFFLVFCLARLYFPNLTIYRKVLAARTDCHTLRLSGVELLRGSVVTDGFY